MYDRIKNTLPYLSSKNYIKRQASTIVTTSRKLAQNSSQTDLPSLRINMNYNHKK